MLQEIIETGKTVDSAIDSACEKMGCAREDCEFEIIDLPKKAFFGLKQIPAKVRVYREVPDPVPAPGPKPQRPPLKKEQPATAKPAAQLEHSDHKPKKEKLPAPPAKPAASKPHVPAQGANLAAFTTEKEKLVTDYLDGIITAMGLSAEYQTVLEDGEVSIQIEGKNLGAIIGRRGETLDAIQYLVSLVANRNEGDYLRITVDCGGYRRKRKTTLEDLAKRLSSQVVKANVSKTLEPMSPFERRVIHATVSNIEGVSSASIGEEPYRRVVISTPTSQMPKRGARSGSGQRDRAGTAAPRRSGGNDSRERKPRGGDRRPAGRGGRSAARPTPVQQEIPAEPKKTPETTGGGLYEKVNL